MITTFVEVVLGLRVVPVEELGSDAVVVPNVGVLLVDAAMTADRWRDVEDQLLSMATQPGGAPDAS